MSVNKVILIGNVGKEPEVRYLENNIRVANFPLATTERGYTMSNGNVVPDRTDWHNIVAWRSLADTTEKYVHKGSQLYIEGKLKTRNYEDKTGVRRYVTEIYAESIQILTRKDNANKEKVEETNTNVEVENSTPQMQESTLDTPF
ncbi:MAG: single-stranded DNA-binding protein [Bacteroidales bacterium]|nr:single-stranded DNA-binding protein [Bacteroidales bacterium]MDD5974729.1 single-stranded DNA-binding protein [Bacteroidales bacterium]MDY5193155.1 single-stranded DNA-binding protein [Candidatus Aphodosoma sp.]